ncbi:hypothetical protein TPHA_0I02760 [Tetrapisispora phaffii CBS 4417]|uniref:SCP domain-containing protein n=1 Tax=Tetrapisispora phaffii (strain ATCC 24235 / CBS 4417 / NBRC 1672 / NRRL Y-8282 / UCD 70-5) TaxID=1071381 RepID=G8BXZ9_TETPH|nr:hypothetical protein TPHA_0I02760 [Tetrapisispora phaffii CBS 4417]CCE64777.1 hypothetical protein TPHA_0I02760 [Tetrapisispora phaffii CBS 4417]
MKLSNLTIAAVASAAAVAAAPAVVVEHVHASPTITVQGYVYFENGVAQTSYTTIDDSTKTQAAAVAAAVVPTLVANANVADSTSSTSTSTSTTTLTQQSTTSSSTTTTEVAAPSTSSTSTQAAAPSTSSTAQAAATTAVATTDSSLSDFANEMLNAHNAKRALHQDTNSLEWSSDLASYAQNYADNYDCSGTLTHSGGSYGENLAAGYDGADAVEAWYSEISSYDFSNPAYSSSTGHFTQLVWKSSTQVGCGFKQCNNDWGTYIICSYNPAGNYIGQFAENVGNLL